MSQGSSQQRAEHSAGRPHSVVGIVDSTSNPFEIAHCAQIFTSMVVNESRQRYDFRLCSTDPDNVTRHGAITLGPVYDMTHADSADTLLAPNRADPHRPGHPEVLAAFQRAAERGARLMACASGAFSLAESGVLDERRATTHWRWAELFRERFPKVRLEFDALFVDDGDRLTSAGGASAIDLCLHVLGRDHGATVANAVAQDLFVAPQRVGKIPQIVRRPLPLTVDDAISPLLAWAQANLDEPLSIADLAARASISKATLYRRFQTKVGMSPLTWLTDQRVGLARRLLEAGDSNLYVIARRSGLGTTANLRALMLRSTGINPTDYRRRYGRTLE